MNDRQDPPSGSSNGLTSGYRAAEDSEPSESILSEDDAPAERRVRRSPERRLRYPPPNASLAQIARLTARCVLSAPTSLPSLLALLTTCRETSATLRSHRPRAVDISRIAEMGDIGRSLVDFWMWRDLLRRTRAGAKSGLFPGGMGEGSSHSGA